MPLKVSPEAAWWDFTKSGGDDLSLSGSSADAALFDPHSNTDDFTVAGVIAPDTEAISNRSGVLTKWNNSTPAKSWLIYTEPTGEIGISVEGSSGTSGVRVAGELSAGAKTFFCGRYHFVTDGTSELHFRANDATLSKSDAVGPVVTETGADVEIADFVGSTDRHYDGKIYWLAYWNRKLTDTEVAGLADNSIRPQQLNPDFYIDFHRAVAATYESDIPQPYTNREFDLAVDGTPTKGGETTSSVDVIAGTGKDMEEEDASGNPRMLWWSLNSFGDGKDVAVHPKISVKERGLGVLQPDKEEKDGGVILLPWEAGFRASLAPTADTQRETVHPKETVKGRGLGVIFELKRE